MLGIRNFDTYGRFTLLFLIFIIGAIFYGSVHIGPISIRNIVTVLMLVACVNRYRSLWIDKMFSAYVVFILFCMISAFLDSYADPVDFILTKIFGYYLPCYVAYFAAYIYFVKNNLSSTPLIITLLLTGSLNAIVSILQFLQLNNIWHNIYSVLCLPLPDLMSVYEEELDMDNTLGYYTTGLFPKAVANGYFLCLSSVLSFFLLLRNTNKDALLFYVVWIMNVVGLFVCQERSAFVLGLLGSSYLLFFLGHKNIPLLCVFVAIAIYFISNELDLDNLGRFSDMSYSGRSRMNDKSISFIAENPLWGGLAHYSYIYKIPPHNLLYNAFIYSGLLGGIILLTVFIKQCWICFKNSIFTTRNYELVVVSIALLAYQGNSFAHNSSLVTGDVTIWLLWGIVSFGYSHASYIKK